MLIYSSPDSSDIFRLYKEKGFDLSREKLEKMKIILNLIHFSGNYLLHDDFMNDLRYSELLKIFMSSSMVFLN